MDRHKPLLYLLTPPRGRYLARVPDLLMAGVEWIQYRRPGVSDRKRIEELRALRTMTRHHDVTLIVNDRPDLALATGADGVHLGSDDLPGPAVQNEWPDLIVGTTQRAPEPLPEGVDYYSVGPVFEPGSKTLDEPACGWSGVKDVIDRTSRPVIAIGGLTPQRVKERPSNCHGVAVISGVWESPDPMEAVKQYGRALKQSTRHDP